MVVFMLIILSLLDCPAPHNEYLNSLSHLQPCLLELHQYRRVSWDVICESLIQSVIACRADFVVFAFALTVSDRTPIS